MSDSQVKELPSHEFVSDYLKASSQDVNEVQEGMKRLTLGSKHQGKILDKGCID